LRNPAQGSLGRVSQPGSSGPHQTAIEYSLIIENPVSSLIFGKDIALKSDGPLGEKEIEDFAL
jgi:hypothetical protein